ncbi:IS4 family transposase [Moorena bouillonii]|uniref:Transposase n=1 Tax=Moorena bouillonii PNG TaxID=568701 RepID=A0A1U7N9U5_9CYAN|nr:IS4 family transposase [Moorena bouillonii]OLT62701.1 transposase [Moorena bouillonii PNG]
MFPQFYQTVFETHLTPCQYLTLQLLILLLQSHRNVRLSCLANLFPQPIKYESRVRNIQRFLNLPQLSAKLLWFPIIKQILKQEFRPHISNRKQIRRRKKLKLMHQGYLLLILDRTQWQYRNLMVLSLAWGHHAIPVYWQLLPKRGNSSLPEQKKVITPVLRLLRSYPVLLLGDREFHSVQLAKWLEERNVDFALRQKKGTCIQDDDAVYRPLKDLGIQPGFSRFYSNISCTKAHQLGNFNLGAYWKRQYRSRASKEPWYILTSLDSLPRTLSCYQARWGIETMFRDLKTGGYNLENTKVSERRLKAIILLISIAYTLATLLGVALKNLGVSEYICRPTESERSTERHSFFWMGLHGPDWIQSLKIWSDLAKSLMSLKPHKSLYFKRGLNAKSLIQSAL